MTYPCQNPFYKSNLCPQKTHNWKINPKLLLNVTCSSYGCSETNSRLIKLSSMLQTRIMDRHSVLDKSRSGHLSSKIWNFHPFKWKKLSISEYKKKRQWVLSIPFHWVMVPSRTSPKKGVLRKKHQQLNIFLQSGSRENTPKQCIEDWRLEWMISQKTR